MARSMIPKRVSEPTEIERLTDRDVGVDGDGSHTCPLCGLAGETERALYVHLQTGHRKSDIARAVLDGVTAE